MDSYTIFERQNAEDDSSALPLVSDFFHLPKVLPTVTAFHDGFLEALVHVGLIAIGVELVAFKFQGHRWVRVRHVVEQNLFWWLWAGRKARTL